MQFKPAFLGVAIVVFCSGLVIAEPAVTARPSGVEVANWAIADRLGCTHVNGAYNCSGSKDFLNEGADEILKLGMKTIKLYLHNPQKMYPFNSKWPEHFRDLVETARHPYYREVFSKPFNTFVLTTYAIGKGAAERWREGDHSYNYADDTRQFHDLAVYLMQTYNGTGKTFILQNWEGDWYVGHKPDLKKDPSDLAIAGMIRWLNARQKGVDDARRELAGRTDVKVYHAAEVNLVRIAMEGRKTVTNDVLPHTHCDLYSYSAYDTTNIAARDLNKGRELFRKALDYIAEKAPDSEAFGSKNVYVGEFGRPSVRHEKQDPHASVETCLQVLQMTVNTSLEWGCPYMVYWQLYDNESRVEDRRPTNDEVRGFYLVKPDCTRAATYGFFESLLR